MFSMPGINWYTDTFDSYRVIDSVEGGITKHTRTKILSACPCRVYQNPTNTPSMTETAAQANDNNVLCCDVGTDLKAGDEIIVYRSSAIRPQPVSTTRYFAGNINIYVEPFGGIVADLEHIQVALLNEERID
jgi:hypothetical protein